MVYRRRLYFTQWDPHRIGISVYALPLANHAEVSILGALWWAQEHRESAVEFSEAPFLSLGGQYSIVGDRVERLRRTLLTWKPLYITPSKHLATELAISVNAELNSVDK